MEQWFQEQSKFFYGVFILNVPILLLLKWLHKYMNKEWLSFQRNCNLGIISTFSLHF
jgi:hypothetical protein